MILPARNWLRWNRRKLRRTPVVTARAGIWAERDGRRLLSFSCNDYLNLSQHPEVIAAAIEATERYGVGAGASRLVTGNHPLYAELESRLARLKGTEAACVFGSGYLANTGIIPALVGADDLILVDELSHACIHAGAKLSGAAVQRYRHADVAHAEALLAAHRARQHTRADRDRRRLFHGRRSGAARRAVASWRSVSTPGCWPTTRMASASSAAAAVRASPMARRKAFDVPLQMGTLSKAVGAYGGYLCASRAVIDLMQTRARTFIYSTGLPPPVVAAAIAALEVIEREPAYAARPCARPRMFARALNLPEAQSAIVPVIVGETDAALAASRAVARRGLSGRRDPAADGAGQARRGCVLPSPRSIPTPRSRGLRTWCEAAC